MNKKIVTGRVRKFSGDEVVVSAIRSDDGNWLLDVRSHFSRGGKLIPSKSGVTVGINKGEQIADAIRMAVELSSWRGK